MHLDWRLAYICLIRELRVLQEGLVLVVACSCGSHNMYQVNTNTSDVGKYMQVLQEVANANPISRALFHMAFNSKRAALTAGNASGGSFAPLWNSLVFSKVKAKLGGRVRLLTTGASPISADVMAFMRVCFPGATVLEGYGVCPCSHPFSTRLTCFRWDGNEGGCRFVPCSACLKVNDTGYEL